MSQVAIVVLNREMVARVKGALPESLKGACRFFVARGCSQTSLARNIACHEGIPVVVIYDEPVSDEELVLRELLVTNFAGVGRQLHLSQKDILQKRFPAFIKKFCKSN